MQQLVDVVGGDGRPAAAADEQDGQVELRGDLPQPWNLGEDVLDDLGVGAEQTPGGEEAADPGGSRLGTTSTSTMPATLVRTAGSPRAAMAASPPSEAPTTTHPGGSAWSMAATSPAQGATACCEPPLSP